MKIGLVVQRFPHGGAESYVEEIATRFHNDGIDVTVISSENKQCDDSLYDFKIVRLSSHFSLGEYSFWKGLEKLLEKEQFDIIHTNTYGYYHSDKVARLKNKLGYKLIMTSHGFTGTDIHKLKKEKIINKTSPLDIFRTIYDENIGKKTLLQCEHLIALSKYDENFYTQIGIDPSKITIIPPGINDLFFKNTDDEDSSISGNPILLSVGELSWIKNHAMIIKALPKILKEKPETHLVLIGRDRGEMNNLKHLCKELGVEEHVTFLGVKNLDEVKKYMNAADLLLQTSYAEGLSTVLLESMACGLPFITTPAGGNGYLADESQAGLTVKFGDSGSLAGNILSLVNDEKVIQTMSSKAQKYAGEYSWDMIFPKILSLYYKTFQPRK